MKTRLFLTTGLLAVFLAACASPQATQPPAPPVEPALPSATAIQPVVSTDLSATPNPVIETPTQAPLPVATSRGPDLHATDPTTVSLASGQYQFVEFFRFTWSTCRAMAPMVHGLEAKYFGKIVFAYLDADDPLTLDFQQTLGFYYQPEIYFLDPNGSVLMKWVGYTSEEELETVFQQFVQ